MILLKASTNNVSIGQNDFDQKRISSLSPSNTAGFNEKNVMVSNNNFNKQQKNLPSYSSYIASKGGNPSQLKTPSTLDLNSGKTLSGYQSRNEQNKQNFQYNKSKSFDTGHLEQGRLISFLAGISWNLLSSKKCRLP